MLDNFKRYQQGIKVENLFPTRKDKLCACGCGQVLLGRKTKWFSDNCRKIALNTYYIIKGDSDVIRENVYLRDKGFCRNCGVKSLDWQADHVVPVFKGGGACGLENFQTLCIDCHKDKSFYLDRLPDSRDILTSSLNILPSSNNTFRAINQRVCKNIIRETVCVSE